MICAKCGHRNQGASWYCAECGSPQTDLNVADSVSGGRSPAVRRMGAATLALFALTVTGLLATRFLDRRASEVALAPSPASEGRAAVSLTAPTPGEPKATPSEGTSTGTGGGAMAGAAAQATSLALQGASDSGGTGGSEPTIPTSAAAGQTISTATRVPTPTPTPSARTRPGNPVWTAPRFATSPEIDGGLNEWLHDHTAFDAVVFGEPEHFEGALDITARAWTGWDENALYVAVRVFDNVFSQPDGAAGRKMYLGDSLELQLDTDLEADWDMGTYNGDDWQIGLSPGNFEGREPEAWTWRPTDRDAGGIRLAALLHNNGYAIECAIPWALLGVDPLRTEAIGWALNVSDNDLPTPVQLTMISSSPSRSWTDPRTFGTLILQR